MGGCKSKFCSLLNPIFPFVQNSRPWGGGVQIEKIGVYTPPQGGVTPPRRGVKGPPLGGCRNTNRKNIKNHNGKNRKNRCTVTPPLWGVKARGGVPKFTGVHGPPLGGSRNIPALFFSTSIFAILNTFSFPYASYVSSSSTQRLLSISFALLMTLRASFFAIV